MKKHRLSKVKAASSTDDSRMSASAASAVQTPVPARPRGAVIDFFLHAKRLWFLGYTAVFALLVAFVFWGTWSTNVAPVMPDCPIVYAPTWFADFWARWTVDGRFGPHNLTVFLGTPYFWQEFQYALCVYLAGLAAAYFLRGRGLSRLAAYGGGLLLAFCGYWLTLFSAGHLGWFQMSSCMVWPFGLVDRAIRKGKFKNWLLTGATVAWGSFWQPDIWLLFSGFIAIYFVYACLRERKLPDWKGLAAAVVAFAVIGTVSVYHAYAFDLKGREEMISKGDALTEGQKRSDGDDARWIFVTNWSLPVDETAEFFIPRLNGDTSCMLTMALGAQARTGVKPYTGAIGRPYQAESGNYRQHSLYVGFVTCLLALFALVHSLADRRSRQFDVWFFTGAAMLFWLCSLGRYCEPVYRLVFMLPFGDTMRCPVKWHHLTELCLVLLAGFGIARLVPLAVRFLGGWGRYAVVALVLVGAVDLARVAKVYCAPVNIAEAKRQNLSMTFTSLHRQAFADPQVAAAVRAKRLVSQAKLSPDVYLVGVLQPWGEPIKARPLGASAWLGIMSVLGGLAVVGYAVRKS